MAELLRAVKGMNDILPPSVPRTEKLPDSALWQWFEAAVRTVLARYGYQHLLTPIVEPTALFVRGLGEVTDIVEKEMYSFVDSMNGDKLTLRPEATAGIVRAMVEHTRCTTARCASGPWARCSATSVRRRAAIAQFHQLDVEALGFAGPDVDAEMILIARALWRELGLSKAGTCASRSTASASPTSGARTARRSCATSRRTRVCSTPTRSAACTPTRCASSTRRTRRCRRWSRPHRS
jgi:histidyl-tRNA synthetase